MHTVHLLGDHGGDGGGAVIEGVGQIFYECIFVGGGRRWRGSGILEPRAKGVIGLVNVRDLFAEAHRTWVGTEGVLTGGSLGPRRRPRDASGSIVCRTQRRSSN